MKKFFTVLLCILAASSAAFAHKISAFVDVEDNTVHLISYFNDGTPVKNGEVEILNASGKVVRTGKTDKNGEFNFKLKKAGDYTAVVTAELGHKASVKFSIGNPNQTAAAEPDSQETPKEQTKSSVNLSKEEFVKILRQELQPIHRELIKIEEQNSKISFRDVIGGIGWIVGIFGMGTFFISYRRKNGTTP